MLDTYISVGRLLGCLECLTSAAVICRFAPAENMFEVDGPLVDHSTILSHPMGLESLSAILKRLGVPSKGEKFSLGGVITFTLNITQRRR